MFQRCEASAWNVQRKQVLAAGCEAPVAEHFTIQVRLESGSGFQGYSEIGAFPDFCSVGWSAGLLRICVFELAALCPLATHSLPMAPRPQSIVSAARCSCPSTRLPLRGTLFTPLLHATLLFPSRVFSTVAPSSVAQLADLHRLYLDSLCTSSITSNSSSTLRFHFCTNTSLRLVFSHRRCCSPLAPSPLAPFPHPTRSYLLRLPTTHLPCSRQTHLGLDRMVL